MRSLRCLAATPLPVTWLEVEEAVWFQNCALEMPTLVLLFCLLSEL